MNKATITYKDIRDILKMMIDFEFDEKKGREYVCLDILNECLENQAPLEVGNIFIAIRKGYDSGYKARMYEEKDNR